MSERLDRIEELLEAAMQQRDQDRRDWLERDLQLSGRLDRVDQQQVQFWEGLNETKALQLRNTEAISQQLELISQMRQAMTEQNRQIQGNRADIARLDREGEAGLN